MLQVARSPKSYSDTARQWHLIKTKRWGGPSNNKMISLQIKYFCEEKESDRTPTKFQPIQIETYDKTVHKKDLCELCVKAIRATIKKG